VNVAVALAPDRGRRQHELPASSDPHEIELKFQLSPEHRAVLEASDALAGSPASELHQVTTYFDTPDAVLHAAGFTLRVRSVGGRFIQTVKSRDGDIGLAGNRNEWEWTVVGEGPDLSRLNDVPRLAGLVSDITDRLEPMFVTDVRRTVRSIVCRDGCVVEVAIDVGTIAASEASELISELELELKAGPSGPLYLLASVLQATAPMWLSTDSKATRGRHLRTGETPAIRLATCPKLNGDSDALVGFGQIMSAALGHLTANIGATLRGDPEGLHQMRIGLRAARATLALFAPSLDSSCVGRLDGELQTVCRAFGVARDWDVFCLETLPAAARDLPAARLFDLDQVAKIARAEAHRVIADLIRGPGFSGTLLSLALWAEAVADVPTVPAVAARRRLANLAPHLLDRVARKTAKRGRHVTRLSPVRLHRFRKALDRLCDDTVVLAALFPHHRVRAYRARCVALQAILGAANDAVVAKMLCASMLEGTRPDLAEPVEAFLVWNTTRRTAALAGLRSATRDFRDTEPFWT
jgi:inorganic triphosphatase YgiF